ncbi:MAG: PQQ-binding-like beta-propeller repeat protein [Gemmatimonadetes bacterium]|nr:PQQ-binding-like beta-propeller repeat protein [Gemmatimonadota bacterium]
MRQIASALLGLAVAGWPGAAMSQQRQGGQKGDQVPSLERIARAFAVGEPPVAWHANPGLVEVDLSILLPGDRLLVGTTDLAGAFGLPSYGPLVALDAGTGRELWRFARVADYDAHYDVLATEPVLLIVRAKADSSAYTALDPDRGAPLWQRTITGAHRIAVDSGGFVVAEGKATQVAISRVDPRTGMPLWTASRPASGTGQSLAEVFVRRDEIVVLDRDLTRLTSSDGNVLTSTAGVGPLSPSSFVLQLGDGTVVGTAEGQLSRVSDEGRILWQARVEGATGVLSHDSARVYVQSLGADGSERITAIAIADGTVLWSQPLEGPVRSTLLAGAETLTFTLDLPGKGRALDIRDPRSGARIVREPILLTPELPDLAPGTNLPPGVHFGSLADHLLPFPGCVVVAQEGGVSSFALPKGEHQWSYDLRQYSDLTFGRQSNMRQLTDARGKPTAPAGAPANAPMVAANFQTTMTSPLAAALRHQAAVFDATRADLKSASSVVRQSAHEARIGAIRGSIAAAERQHAAERSAARRQLVVASMAALSGPIASLLSARAVRAVQKASLEAEVKRNAAGLKWSPQVHAKSVQGDFYIRPFFVYKDHLGVLVVNMATGGWAEITTMPNIDGLMERGMRTQFPTVTATSLIVMRGTGTDPSIWTPFVWGAVRMPQPGLLAYDLDKLPLQDAGTFPSRVALRQWGIVSASPSSIKKGDHVISLVPISGADGKAFAAGTRFTAATSPDLDSYRSLWLVDAVGSRVGARDHMLRKEGAPWPTFPKGSTVAMGWEQANPVYGGGAIWGGGVGYSEAKFRAMKGPMWEATWGTEHFELGQIFTVEGASADGTFTLVTTAAGAKYYIPHTLLVAPPAAK